MASDDVNVNGSDIPAVKIDPSRGAVAPEVEGKSSLESLIGSSCWSAVTNLADLQAL